MAITKQAKKLVRRDFDFVGGINVDKFTSAGTGATFDASTINGAEIEVTGTTDARFDFGDNLNIDIANLVSLEFLCRIQTFADSVFAYFGIASAYASDFADIATHCLAVVGSASPAVAGKWPVNVHWDDGTTDDSIDSGFTFSDDDWHRICFNFKTGVQTKQPPAVSLGGLSNIQFSITDDKLGYQHKMQAPSKLIDISAATGGVQLIFGGQMAAGSAVSHKIQVKEVCCEYELPT